MNDGGVDDGDVFLSWVARVAKIMACMLMVILICGYAGYSTGREMVKSNARKEAQAININLQGKLNNISMEARGRGMLTISEIERIIGR